MQGRPVVPTTRSGGPPHRAGARTDPRAGARTDPRAGARTSRRSGARLRRGAAGLVHAAPARWQPDALARRSRDWLLDGTVVRAKRIPGPHREPSPGTAHTRPWWKVMCLTGVDYFSTLGYQPGIAALAAGAVSPIATIVLVSLTLFGALPIYRRVAAESPRGEGSIAMLEKLLNFWAGKLLVLVLLGFLATDFMITITLSAADATAHAVENPFAPDWLHGREVLLTLLLITALGAVFLKGFGEAIGIAVGIVGVYLVMNVVVIAVAVADVVGHPQLVVDWRDLLVSQHPNPFAVVAVALLVFPRLALGLSGFETGVAVMPQVRGAPDDDPKRPAGRIAGTRRLLTTAAVIMSVFLITSSFVTTVLIPAQLFAPGGEANGRALAYLAHKYLGDGFGTLYDVSTISILWFAGASALAGLLNIVPRYLPRYGMAPEWARAVRPLVLIFVAIAFVVTLAFDASVDAQGGAYATGVLVLMLSASFAVTLSSWRRRARRLHTGLGAPIAFSLITLVFLYTTIANIFERPEGVRIAGLFILGILAVSLVARITRSTELRVTSIELDPAARRILSAAADGTVRLIPSDPADRNALEYLDKERRARETNHIPDPEPVVFLEIVVRDASDFEEDLVVHGGERYGFRVLTCQSSSVPNAIAALLLEVRDTYDTLPHVYFTWTEGNPLSNIVRFLVFGHGEVAPVTREVLREAETDPHRRPFVHVG